jgi:bacillolysin
MCSNGTAITRFYGVQNIDSEFYTGINKGHYLHALDGVRDIHTKRYSALNSFNTSPHITTTNNQGNWGTHEWEATNVHWSATEAHDYFYNTFYRKGMNNQGNQTRILIDYNGEGAFYNPVYRNDNDVILIGEIENKFIGAIDIVGHEYTHGITRYTSKLVYEDEPGALNESFSDIFGIAIERYSQTQLWNLWAVGE